MELAEEMIKIQTEKELKRTNEGSTTWKGFDGSSVILTVGGAPIGTFQSMSIEYSVTAEHERLEREALNEWLIGETETPPWGQLYQQLNRAEKRKKASARKEEKNQDPYRKGLRTMLGGRGRWS